MRDLFSERVDYRNDHLLEDGAPDEPFSLFDAWLADAFSARDAGTARHDSPYCRPFAVHGGRGWSVALASERASAATSWM